MGFSEARSKKVLQHFKNNFEAAMAHMLNTDESADALILNHGQPVSFLGFNLSSSSLTQQLSAQGSG